LQRSRPKPANDGDRALAAKGRTIYLEGIPEANIVSCYACHGPNAEGVRDIPRLGGLAYFYLKGRLEQWNEGYHSAPSPMPMVASHLGPAEIEGARFIPQLCEVSGGLGFSGGNRNLRARPLPDFSSDP